MFKPIEHGFVPPCSELMLGNTLLTTKADFFKYFWAFQHDAGL